MSLALSETRKTGFVVSGSNNACPLFNCLFVPFCLFEYIYSSTSSKLLAIKCWTDVHQWMSALQVHLMSLKAHVNKYPSFMAFRRKFTLKMLTPTLLDTV